MTDRGGDHGSEEKGRKGQEARGEEEGREEAREEVVLPEDPGVGASADTRVQSLCRKLSKAFKEGLGRDVDVKNLVLPPGFEDAEVDVRLGYEDEGDENMRMVHEVNEDPADTLHVSVTKQVPVALEYITISLSVEEK